MDGRSYKPFFTVWIYDLYVLFFQLKETKNQKKKRKFSGQKVIGNLTSNNRKLVK